MGGATHGCHGDSSVQQCIHYHNVMRGEDNMSHDTSYDQSCDDSFEEVIQQTSKEETQRHHDEGDDESIDGNEIQQFIKHLETRQPSPDTFLYQRDESEDREEHEEVQKILHQLLHHNDAELHHSDTKLHHNDSGSSEEERDGDNDDSDEDILNRFTRSSPELYSRYVVWVSGFS